MDPSVADFAFGLRRAPRHLPIKMGRRRKVSFSFFLLPTEGGEGDREAVEGSSFYPISFS
ncbi:hypothetical protein ABAC402_11765 [Asticcacaulis sp. AC402]|nr:hypothetical protein ABAC402_11765 [Asticcacaulis sp. AC402]